ncbi:MAG: class I SAM-dependent methyltransferase [Vicingaceae bacterium]
MKEYSACPICGHNTFKKALSCKDYTVSQETFKINDCNACGFRFTNPVPEEKDIGPYYESEEYISHSNSSRGFINFLYQKVRNITLKQKLNLIERVSEGKTLLDIGSGTGEFLATCKKAGYQTKGIEPSKKAREFSIENHQLEVNEESALNEIKHSSIDIVSMWHVLEHVYPLNERVDKIHYLLKSGGKAIIAVPNHDSYDATKYKHFWAAYDVPRHLYHFKKADIKTLFESNGFILEETLPMKFDSYYVSMLSEKYKNGSANIFNAFFTGFISNIKAKAGKSPGYSSQIYVFRKK